VTYDAIVAEVMARCNLTSSDATTRVGQAVNRHYRRITSLLGMEVVRFTGVNVAMTVAQATVTVPAVEKIDRVFLVQASETQLLPEVSLHTIRTMPRGTGAPTAWAMSDVAAGSVTIQTDTLAQQAWPLLVDGWGTLTDLSGSQEPAFPASFHDILTWFVMSEELLRKEKGQLATAYESKADALLNDLRFHLADTHTRTLRQNNGGSGQAPGGTGGGGGGAPSGGLSYTQTGLITFDRDPNAPFAVTPGSAAVPNLIADQALSIVGKTVVDVTGTPAANQLALFNDADTVKGDAALTLTPSPHPALTVMGPSGSDAILTLIESGVVPKTRLWKRRQSLGPYSFLGVNIYHDGAAWVRDDPAQGGIFVRFGADGTVQVVGTGTGGTQVTSIATQSDGVTTVRFAPTQVPSADPNTLDDYREGPWTPALIGTGGQSGQSYTGQDGQYVKIGKRIDVCGYLHGTTGTISGNVQIGGLPFAQDPQPPSIANVAAMGGLARSISSVFGIIGGWGSRIELYLVAGGGAMNGVPLVASDLAPNFNFAFSATYFV
jgi:hypothetical protein